MSSRNEARIASLCRTAHERISPHPRSLDDLRQAKVEAAAEAEEALRLAEQEWGASDPRLSRILGLLAQCVGEVEYGDHDEGPLPHLLRAIAIAEGCQSVDMEELGGLYLQAGLALRSAGALERAREMLEMAIGAFEKLGRAGDVCFCVGTLATTLVALDPFQAVEVCRRHVELEGHDEPKSTSHYVALEQLGRCLVLVGRGREALDVLVEARALLLERTKGRPHRWMVELEAEIGRARALANDDLSSR